MHKFLTCVLTSGTYEHAYPLLIRCLSYSRVPLEDTVVVINTQSKGSARAIRRSLSVHFPTLRDVVITESNGKPGKGHQSVLDYFSEQEEYDYLIKIDGDDFLLSGAHERIREYVSNLRTPIDALGLLGEKILTGPVLGNPRDLPTDAPVPLFTWPSSSADGEIGLTHEGTRVAWQNMQHLYSGWNQDMYEWMSTITSIVGNEDYWFDRIICFSKKGAQQVRYCEELPCCVDVQFNALMKLAAINGEVNYGLVEYRNCYIYDRILSFGASRAAVEHDDIPALKELFESRFTDYELHQTLPCYFLYKETIKVATDCNVLNFLPGKNETVYPNWVKKMKKLYKELTK